MAPRRYYLHPSMLTTLLCATLLGAAAAPASPGTASTADAASQAPLRARAPLIAGIGAGLVLTGSALWLVGNVQQGTAAATPQRSIDLQSASRTSQQNQLGGMGLTLVGLCTVGIAAVMWNWMPDRPAVSASAMLVPKGGGLSLSGTFP